MAYHFQHDSRKFFVINRTYWQTYPSTNILTQIRLFIHAQSNRPVTWRCHIHAELHIGQRNASSSDVSESQYMYAPAQVSFPLSSCSSPRAAASPLTDSNNRVNLQFVFNHCLEKKLKKEEVPWPVQRGTSWRMPTNFGSPKFFKGQRSTWQLNVRFLYY